MTDGRRSTELLEQTMEKRPTGMWQIIVGAIAMVVGGGCLFFGIMAADAVSAYPGAVSEPVTWKWPLTWLGVGLLNLGFALWALGQLLRAIYFLPGEEWKSF